MSIEFEGYLRVGPSHNPISCMATNLSMPLCWPLAGVSGEEALIKNHTGRLKL